MIFSAFNTALKEELEKPLPGRAVQLTMSSIKRIRELFDFSKQNQAVKSSVLILLYPDPSDGAARFVLMLRPTYDGIHSGQISLPGGKYEIMDADLCATALRETHEEIGIDIQQVSVVINFDISKCVHTYLHRIGRSGRWGRKGVGINLITRRDIPKMKEIEMYYACQINELPAALDKLMM